MRKGSGKPWTLERIKSNCTIDDNGCCVWQRSVVTSGYGQIETEGRCHRAHKMAYEFVNGPVPEGLSVLHSCDVTRCCNPDHLRTGTQRENVYDMISRGRAVQYGSGHTKAILTPAQVEAIRADPRTSRAIARDYGISQSTATRATGGFTYKDVA